MRYPLLFPNRHSYRFLRKYPFIHFGCAISFYIERPLMQRRLLRFVSRQTSAIFPLPLLSLISLAGLETAISIRRTRLLPDLRPIVFSTMQRIWLLNGISFLPLQPQTADTLSRLMFFPPTCRNGSGLVSVDGQVFHVSESAADCFASTFSRPLSI